MKLEDPIPHRMFTDRELKSIINLDHEQQVARIRVRLSRFYTRCVSRALGDEFVKWMIEDWTDLPAARAFWPEFRPS